MIKNLIIKLNKVRNKLANNEGAGYVEVLVTVVVLFLVITVIISSISVFTKQSDLKTFANSVLRTAELTGNIGNEVNTEITRQKTLLGINPTITFNKSGRIDLGDEIELEASLTVDIGSSSFGNIPITLRYRAKGRGEVYWKWKDIRLL